MFLSIGYSLAFLESKEQASHLYPALKIFYLLSTYFLASMRINIGTTGAKLLLLTSSVILEKARNEAEVD